MQQRETSKKHTFFILNQQHHHSKIIQIYISEIEEKKSQLSYLKLKKTCA